jgi:nucleolar protein 56
MATPSILTDEAVLFETEGGAVVLQGDKVLISQRKGTVSRSENLAIIGEKARAAGLTYIGTTDAVAADELVKLGIASSQVSEAEKDQLNAKKLEIMVSAGFAEDESAALAMIREMAVAAAEASIIETSSREDLQLVHGIQALDELDKFLNITSERVVEWYGLHFPELQQLLGDNVLLCKIVVEVGSRDKFDEERLQGKGFSEKKVEALVLAAAESKGGTITERDMNRLVGVAGIALGTSAEREKLAEYVESTMKKIAPNTTDVAGATIGARLIAKAGGLDRLARLPASTIQVLGAEKALFRALRTGARPPKHGILFQHDAVHMAPKWQRGKIARALANKIAIAARVDYYRGEKEGGLTSTLEKRLDEIRIKYKEPKVSQAPDRPFRNEKRYRPGDRGKERGTYKKSRPGRENVWRKPRRDRRDPV